MMGAHTLVESLSKLRYQPPLVSELTVQSQEMNSNWHPPCTYATKIGDSLTTPDARGSRPIFSTRFVILISIESALSAELTGTDNETNIVSRPIVMAMDSQEDFPNIN